MEDVTGPLLCLGVRIVGRWGSDREEGQGRPVEHYKRRVVIVDEVTERMRNRLRQMMTWPMEMEELRRFVRRMFRRDNAGAYIAAVQEHMYAEEDYLPLGYDTLGARYPMVKVDYCIVQEYMTPSRIATRAGTIEPGIHQMRIGKHIVGYGCQENMKGDENHSLSVASICQNQIR